MDKVNRAEVDTRSEAELLRSNYRRDDGWHSTNNAQVGGNVDMLIQSIKTWEEKARDDRAVEAKAKKKFDAAQAELRQAQGNRHDSETNLKIRKMALAEAMEIPS